MDKKKVVAKVGLAKVGLAKVGHSRASELQEQLPSALKVWNRKDGISQSLFRFESSCSECSHERF